jgi:hypothetical protein
MPITGVEKKSMSVSLRSIETLNRVTKEDTYAIVVIDNEGEITIYSDLQPAKAELLLVLENGMEDYE